MHQGTARRGGTKRTCPGQNMLMEQEANMHKQDSWRAQQDGDGRPAEPVVPPSEPLTPSPEPLTPPSEPVTPPPEPVTPPSEPLIPAPEPMAHRSGANGAAQVPVPAEPGLAEQLAIAKASEHELAQAMRQAAIEVGNTRRRVNEEMNRAHKYAIEGFAEAVLPVKDSLETALQIQTPSVDALKEGMAITLKQLDAAFARNQLIEINPQPGEKLDLALHRPISMVPAPGSANTIVSVLQKGYLIGERLLRPALVTVVQERTGGAEQG